MTLSFLDDMDFQSQLTQIPQVVLHKLCCTFYATEAQVIISVIFERQKRLSAENVDQNMRIDAIEDTNENLKQDYNKTESHLLAVNDALQELKYQDDMIKLEVSRKVLSGLLSSTILQSKIQILCASSSIRPERLTLTEIEQNDRLDIIEENIPRNITHDLDNLQAENARQDLAISKLEETQNNHIDKFGMN